ncbi:MAG TPA: hypothetical protein VHE34_08945 [Puia sp.]|uniref:hypothetical protein n=1 Tax=Puia sp. TaxID=2045100 RepID=UPI002C1EDBA5|nr:hypothetical protein [Puia sp.]HVU95338.1 hypothetical protein [Puia sp.]
MEDVLMIAEVNFIENTKIGFKFPVMNPIRMSFWISPENPSTPAEITPLGTGFMEPGKKYMAEIAIIDRDFLKDQLHVGCEFKLGTFPVQIAQGKIMEMKK